ncbi:hypothetical protein E2C01_022949 [Portunus trituberculatus]|uniref:Uncharacterized protein n=1 Tax=Portunus trituberculatus TaxID=210409 RepID=A0A5B7E9W2_PORTR|nr:hypothetical protein [Portunus trituberculatus]
MGPLIKRTMDPFSYCSPSLLLCTAREPLSSITLGEQSAAPQFTRLLHGSPPRPLAKHGTRTFIERAAFLNLAETKRSIDFL